MTPEQVSFWLQLLSAFGVGGVIAAAVVAYFLHSFVPSYLSKKADNLATREDIAAITREIEEVKNSYAVLLEGTKTRNQLRMAALEERLRAHQEAFALWRGLNRVAHDADGSTLRPEIQKCQDWWDRNCLYLTSESREAFAGAFWAAHYLTSEMQAKLPPQDVQRRWEQLSLAGSVLVASVALPPLNEVETRDVTREA